MKKCKTCLNSPQSTPFFDSLAQPTKITEPIKQCVVLTGTPILVASRTVNAAPSSIVNPLEVKQVNYISQACNISTSWGRKLTICLYLVLKFSEHIHHAASLRSAPFCFITQCNTLLHYAHAPCRFISQCTMLLHYAVYHAVSLRTCTKKKESH